MRDSFNPGVFFSQQNQQGPSSKPNNFSNLLGSQPINIKKENIKSNKDNVDLSELLGNGKRPVNANIQRPLDDNSISQIVNVLLDIKQLIQRLVDGNANTNYDSMSAVLNKHLKNTQLAYDEHLDDLNFIRQDHLKQSDFERRAFEKFYINVFERYTKDFNFRQFYIDKNIEKVSKKYNMTMGSINVYTHTSNQIASKNNNAPPEVLNVLFLSSIHELLRHFALDFVSYSKRMSTGDFVTDLYESINTSLIQELKTNFFQTLYKIPIIGQLTAGSLGILLKGLSSIPSIVTGLYDFYKREKTKDKLVKKYSSQKPPEVRTADAVTKIPGLLESQRTVLLSIQEILQNIYSQDNQMLTEMTGNTYSYKETQNKQERVYVEELGQFLSKAEHTDYLNKKRNAIAKDVKRGIRGTLFSTATGRQQLTNKIFNQSEINNSSSSNDTLSDLMGNDFRNTGRTTASNNIAPGTSGTGGSKIFDNLEIAVIQSGSDIISKLNTDHSEFMTLFKKQFNIQLASVNRNIRDFGKEQVKLLQELIDTVKQLKFKKEHGELHAFAKGGVYSAGVPRLVGEKGPEIEVPKTGGRILSNKMVSELLAIDYSKFGSVMTQAINVSNIGLAASPESDNSTFKQVKNALNESDSGKLAKQELTITLSERLAELKARKNQSAVSQTTLTQPTKNEKEKIPALKKDKGWLWKLIDYVIDGAMIVGIGALLAPILIPAFKGIFTALFGEKFIAGVSDFIPDFIQEMFDDEGPLDMMFNALKVGAAVVIGGPIVLALATSFASKLITSAVGGVFDLIVKGIGSIFAPAAAGAAGGAAGAAGAAGGAAGAAAKTGIAGVIERHLPKIFNIGLPRILGGMFGFIFDGILGGIEGYKKDGLSGIIPGVLKGALTSSGIIGNAFKYGMAGLMMGGPPGMFAGIIIGSAVQLIFDNWDSIKAGAGALWDGVSGMFGDLWNYISSPFISFFKPISDGIGTFTTEVAKFFSSDNQILAFLNDMWGTISSPFIQFFEFISTKISEFQDRLMENITSIPLIGELFKSNDKLFEEKLEQLRVINEELAKEKLEVEQSAANARALRKASGPNTKWFGSNTPEADAAEEDERSRKAALDEKQARADELKNELTSMNSNALAGVRMKGGPVVVGSTYLAGEGGPEILLNANNGSYEFINGPQLLTAKEKGDILPITASGESNNAIRYSLDSSTVKHNQVFTDDDLFAPGAVSQFTDGPNPFKLDTPVTATELLKEYSSKGMDLLGQGIDTGSAGINSLIQMLPTDSAVKLSDEINQKIITRGNAVKVPDMSGITAEDLQAFNTQKSNTIPSSEKNDPVVTIQGRNVPVVMPSGQNTPIGMGNQNVPNIQNDISQPLIPSLSEIGNKLDPNTYVKERILEKGYKIREEELISKLDFNEPYVYLYRLDDGRIYIEFMDTSKYTVDKKEMPDAHIKLDTLLKDESSQYKPKTKYSDKSLDKDEQNSKAEEAKQEGDKDAEEQGNNAPKSGLDKILEGISGAINKAKEEMEEVLKDPLGSLSKVIDVGKEGITGLFNMLPKESSVKLSEKINQTLITNGNGVKVPDMSGITAADIQSFGKQNSGNNTPAGSSSGSPSGTNTPAGLPSGTPSGTNTPAGLSSSNGDLTQNVANLFAGLGGQNVPAGMMGGSGGQNVPAGMMGGSGGQNVPAGIPGAPGGINASGGIPAVNNMSSGGTNANKAMDYFMSKGWTKEQAAGIVGNLQQESGQQLNPNAQNKNGMYGLAQWDSNRRAGFEKKYGKSIKGSTVEEQLEYINWELTQGPEKRAGRALKNATNAQEAAHIFEKKYERSGGSALDKRIANANKIYGSHTPGQQAVGGQGNTPITGIPGALGGMPGAPGTNMPTGALGTNMPTGALGTNMPTGGSGGGLLSNANKYLGMSEGQNADQLNKFTGVNTQTTPWCGAFVGGVLKESGYRVPKGHNLAKNYLNYGQDVGGLANAKPGDIAVFNRGGGGKGHVGIIQKIEGDKVYLLGGNQGKEGIVSVSARDINKPGSELVGIRRPGQDDIIDPQKVAATQAQGGIDPQAVANSSANTTNGTNPDVNKFASSPINNDPKIAQQQAAQQAMQASPYGSQIGQISSMFGQFANMQGSSGGGMGGGLGGAIQGAMGGISGGLGGALSGAMGGMSSGGLGGALSGAMSGLMGGMMGGSGGQMMGGSGGQMMGGQGIPSGNNGPMGAVASGLTGSVSSSKDPAVLKPELVGRLSQDLGITPEQASGIVGNLAHESGNFKHHQEINPKSGRGGIGWAQWTGPRRKAFEKFAAEKGLDLTSNEASYQFLKHELNTTEKASLDAVKRTSSAEESARAFEGKFERAGVKHYGSRFNHANEALAAYNKNPAISSPQIAGQNNTGTTTPGDPSKQANTPTTGNTNLPVDPSKQADPATWQPPGQQVAANTPSPITGVNTPSVDPITVQPTGQQVAANSPTTGVDNGIQIDEAALKQDMQNGNLPMFASAGQGVSDVTDITNSNAMVRGFDQSKSTPKGGPRDEGSDIVGKDGTRQQRMLPDLKAQAREEYMAKMGAPLGSSQKPTNTPTTGTESGLSHKQQVADRIARENGATVTYGSQTPTNTPPTGGPELSHKQQVADRIARENGATVTYGSQKPTNTPPTGGPELSHKQQVSDEMARQNGMTVTYGSQKPTNTPTGGPELSHKQQVADRIARENGATVTYGNQKPTNTPTGTNSGPPPRDEGTDIVGKDGTRQQRILPDLKTQAREEYMAKMGAPLGSSTKPTSTPTAPPKVENSDQKRKEFEGTNTPSAPKPTSTPTTPTTTFKVENSDQKRKEFEGGNTPSAPKPTSTPTTPTTTFKVENSDQKRKEFMSGTPTALKPTNTPTTPDPKQFKSAEENIKDNLAAGMDIDAAMKDAGIKSQLKYEAGMQGHVSRAEREAAYEKELLAGTGKDTGAWPGVSPVDTLNKPTNTPTPPPNVPTQGGSSSTSVVSSTKETSAALQPTANEYQRDRIIPPAATKPVGTEVGPQIPDDVKLEKDLETSVNAGLTDDAKLEKDLEESVASAPKPVTQSNTQVSKRQQSSANRQQSSNIPQSNNMAPAGSGGQNVPAGMGGQLDQISGLLGGGSNQISGNSGFGGGLISQIGNAVGEGFNQISGGFGGGGYPTENPLVMSEAPISAPPQTQFDVQSTTASTMQNNAESTMAQSSMIGEAIGGGFTGDMTEGGSDPSSVIPQDMMSSRHNSIQPGATASGMTRDDMSSVPVDPLGDDIANRLFSLLSPSLFYSAKNQAMETKQNNYIENIFI